MGNLGQQEGPSHYFNECHCKRAVESLKPTRKNAFEIESSLVDNVQYERQCELKIFVFHLPKVK